MINPTPASQQGLVRTGLSEQGLVITEGNFPADTPALGTPGAMDFVWHYKLGSALNDANAAAEIGERVKTLVDQGFSGTDLLQSTSTKQGILQEDGSILFSDTQFGPNATLYQAATKGIQPSASTNPNFIMGAHIEITGPFSGFGGGNENPFFGNNSFGSEGIHMELEDDEQSVGCFESSSSWGCTAVPSVDPLGTGDFVLAFRGSLSVTGNPSSNTLFLNGSEVTDFSAGSGDDPDYANSLPWFIGSDSFTSRGLGATFKLKKLVAHLGVISNGDWTTIKNWLNS